MSDDDTPAENADETSMNDATEAATDGGTAATETPQSRFWGVVPSGWELVEGSEVYDVNPSYTPEDEEITYIEMDALDTELPFPKYTKKRKAADYSGKLFREGDTLFARITPCTENGKTAFVDEMETDVGIGSTEYAVLSPDRDRIHPMYLYYVAKSHPVRNYAISRMRGSTGRQRVPFDVFRKELEVSLPPMEEQRKIIAALLNLDNAVENTDKILEKYETIRKGVVNNLFTNGVAESSETTSTPVGEQPSHWEIERLDNLLTDTRYGTDEKSNTDGEGYPTLRIPNVVGKRLTLDDLKHTPLTNDEADRLRLEQGDLLVVRTNGNPDYVGQSVVFDENNDEDFMFASYLIRLRVDENNLLPEFLREYLHSTRGRAEMKGWIRTSAGNYNLSVGSIEKLHVPIPPVEEQQEIVSRINEVDAAITANEGYRSQLKRLKRGLMQDLIPGDVHPPNSDFEVPDEVSKYG